MWGILPISVTMGLPETSSPKETANFEACSLMASDSIIFFRGTNSGERLGSSIPTKLLPGMGASILIVPVGAAKARAKSRSRAVIFESLVPRATSRAYWVTAGPKLTSTTRAVIPKDSRVFSMMAAFPLMSPLSALPPSTSLKSSRGGYFQTICSPGTLLTSFGAKGSPGAFLAKVEVGGPPETLSWPRAITLSNRLSPKM